MTLGNRDWRRKNAEVSQPSKLEIVLTVERSNNNSIYSKPDCKNSKGLTFKHVQNPQTPVG